MAEQETVAGRMIGTYEVGDVIWDPPGEVWQCVEAGAPGVWQWRGTLNTASASAPESSSLWVVASGDALVDPLNPLG